MQTELRVGVMPIRGRSYAVVVYLVHTCTRYDPRNVGVNMSAHIASAVESQYLFFKQYLRIS